MTDFRNKDNLFDCKNRGNCINCVYGISNEITDCAIELLQQAHQYNHQLRNELTEEDFRDLIYMSDE